MSEWGSVNDSVVTVCDTACDKVYETVCDTVCETVGVCGWVWLRV